MDRTDIKQIVSTSKELSSKLYCRGFLVTTESINLFDYPFCGNWKESSLGKFKLYTHSLTRTASQRQGSVSVILIGNAYNPFTMELKEENIAGILLEYYLKDFLLFTDYFNCLTGVFVLIIIDGNEIKTFSDPVGLYSLFYLEDTNHIFISSHSNLIGDILNFQQSEYLKRLKKCKTYTYFGYQLPGNITQFDKVKRVVPNHYLHISSRITQIRFYYPHYIKMDDEGICNRLISILENTMQCISMKWNNPAISLTGGCDSKTTLAAAHKNYSDYFCFSYDSQPNEKPDADAAEIICSQIGMPFRYYKIPYEDSAFDSIEEVRKILLWNCGDIRYNNPNDVRKRIYLDKIDDYDIEVKSWASEVGRSRYTKRYWGKRHFGKKPTPRKCTTFYKFLFFDRKLVNTTDAIFKEYLEHYFVPAPECPVPWQDQFYWEWHWPSRDGISLTCEQQYSNEITVPYNNRIVLELLLSVDEDGRINDRIYTSIREKIDKRIDKATDSIIDVNHTSKRAFGELVYYYLNTILPY